MAKIHCHVFENPGYNTLHFALQSYVLGRALFGYTLNKQALCRPAGSMALFAVSSPFHGLRAVPCKLT